MSDALEVTDRTPYPGLRPYKLADAWRFFGRNDQISRMLERLEDHRFLAVVGSSGCGKSSLVYAGLLPALQEGWLNGALPEWKFVTLRPGESPLQNLASELVNQLYHTGETDPRLETAVVRNRLEQGRLGLLQAIDDAPLEDNTNVLVFVDQFEELFRYRERAEREGQSAQPVQTRYDRANESIAFVNLLLTAADRQAQRGPPVYVMLSMRSDFLGSCDLFQGLPEAISDSQFLTPRMTRDELRDVIVEPLKLFKARTEPGLVDRILNDVGAEQDQLPLMQHALMRAWNVACQPPDTWKSQTIELGERHYLDARVGGVARALDQHADELYRRLADVPQPSTEPARPPRSELPHPVELANWLLRPWKTDLATLTRRLESQLASRTGGSPPAQPGDSPTAPAGASPEAAAPPRADPARQISDLVETPLLRITLRGLNELQRKAEPPPSRKQWLCERMFRSLSDTNASGQVIRRLAKIREIAAEAEPAVDNPDPRVAEEALERVSGEIAEIARLFLAPDCALLQVSSGETAEARPASTPGTLPSGELPPRWQLSSETTLDISHEALLRQWERCRQWVTREAEGGAVWRKVVEQAASLRAGTGGYFGNADLRPIEEWQEQQRPTARWAARHTPSNRSNVTFAQARDFLRRSRFRLRTLVFLVLASLAAILWFSWSTIRANARREQEKIVSQQVSRMLAGDVNQIAPLLRDLNGKQEAWVPQVLARLQEQSASPQIRREQRNAALALLDERPPSVDLAPLQTLIVDSVLQASPEEIAAIRPYLAPRSHEVTPQLLQTLEGSSSRYLRLRAAAVLSGLHLEDLERERWIRLAFALANDLVVVSPVEVSAWAKSLRGARELLLPELVRFYQDRRTSQRTLRESAALILAEQWRDDRARLIDWLLQADSGPEFQPFVRALRDGTDGSSPERPSDPDVLPDLTQILAELDERAGDARFWSDVPPEDQETIPPPTWRGALNAAVAMIQLGHPERARRFLLPARRNRNDQTENDPTFQSLLIERIQKLEAIDAVGTPQLLVAPPGGARFEPELRAALLLALGDYDSVRLSPSQQRSQLIELGRIYVTEEHAAVRSAAGWVWTVWQSRLQQGGDTALLDEDSGLLDESGRRSKQWLVNSLGEPYVIIPAPGKIDWGPPGNRRSSEIPYSLAVAAHEVRLTHWQRFATPEVQAQYPSVLRERSEELNRTTPSAACPVNGISWYNAAAYCNWLSDREGLERCYQPNSAGQYAEGMSLAADFLTKTGYRLPTEEEWEYVCRGDSTTSFSFGEPKHADLIPRYAWWAPDSDSTTHPVGLLRPNRFGLFDVHGNVFEWLNTRKEIPVRGGPDDPVRDDQSWLAAGGAFRSQTPLILESSHRFDYRPFDPFEYLGMRLVRTLR